MGNVVELLGIPGCGKSTLVDYCAPNPKYIIQRKDLKPSKLEREFIRRFYIDPKLIFKNHAIHSFIKEYPEADKLFVRKLIEMHYKLKKTGVEIVLLDEGLIDRMTGIPFDKNLVIDNAFLNVVEMINSTEALVFNCQCPIEVSSERLRLRERTGDNASGRYYDKSDEILKNKLMIKQHNNDVVLSCYKGRIVTLDMTKPIEDNAKIIQDTINEEFSIANKKLWLKAIPAQLHGK